MMEPIETLLFDFGGTLDADGVAWKERFHTLYRAEGLDIAADAFAPIFFAADDPLVGSLSSTADLSETVTALATNLEVELTRRGAETENAGIVNEQNRGQRVASRFLFEASAALTRNRPVLEALKARYRLGIVSNFYGNLEAVCRSAAIAPLFGVMVDSQCVGAEKPDPVIFRAALERLGATPEKTVFIGDSLRRDREGARRMGMRFIWVAPPDVQARQSERQAEPAVTDLRDVTKFLQ